MTRNWLQFLPIVVQFSLPRSPYATNITNIHNYDIAAAFPPFQPEAYVFFSLHFLMISFLGKPYWVVCVCARAPMSVSSFIFFVLGKDCSGVSPCEGGNRFEGAMNFEFEREIGFINSQPSLAECLTSFPAVLESFQTSSIKESTVIPPPFEHTIPSLSPCTGSQPKPASGSQRNRRASATNGDQTHHRAAQPPCAPGQAPSAPATPVGPLAHEFPWMKEKKSSKKGPKPGASSVAGGAIITPASSYPSPTASGYASAGMESPTGR